MPELTAMLAFYKLPSKKRSKAFLCASLILFLMPSLYLDELESISIGRTVVRVDWQRFLFMLIRNWENSITQVSSTHSQFSHGPNAIKRILLFYPPTWGSLLFKAPIQADRTEAQHK